MAKRSGQPFTMRTEWKAGPTNRLGKSSGAASSPAHSVGSAFRPPAARIEDLCALLAAPRSRMAPSLPDPACAAVHTDSSATCSSPTPTTRLLFGAASGPTGNAAPAGLQSAALSGLRCILIQVSVFAVHFGSTTSARPAEQLRSWREWLGLAANAANGPAEGRPPLPFLHCD